MRQHLFVPDDMTRTSMVWESRFESDYANGYDEYGRSLGPERRTTADAAGSMQTTLRDYAKFLQALLQGRDLRPNTREQMLSPQIQILSKHEFPSLATETTTENKSIRLKLWLWDGDCTGLLMAGRSLKRDMTKAGGTMQSVSTSRALES